MMTLEQVEQSINRISWGNDFITVKDSSGREFPLIVGTLSLRSKNFIEYQYKKAISDSEKEGVMTEKEMLRELELLGIWTKDDEEKIDYLYSELKKIEDKDSEIEKTNREQKKVERLKKSIKSHILELEKKRRSLLSNCAERFAEDIRIRALIYCITKNIDESPYWKSWDEFCNEMDGKLIENIGIEIAKINKPNIKQIRQVARSPLWRCKWGGAKAVGDLFGKPIAELSDEQSALIYWSQVYDSVYEAYERPSQEIIEDDDKLDRWLTEQGEKSEKEAKQRITSRSDGQKFGSKNVGSKVARHGEVFVMANKDEDKNAPSPEDIYDLNSEVGKKFLKVQRDRLKKAGIINESDLRKDKDSRRVIGSRDAVISRKRGSDGFTRKHVDKLLPGGTL